MTAGMPGTGIGGLFYFALAFWMPFHELFLTFQGKSSWKRWRFIAFQWVMISVILACLWGAGMAVTYGCMWLQQTFSPGSALIKATFLASMKQTKGLAFASAFGASLSLGFVLCFTHVLRFVVRRQINRRAIKTATRPITGITPTLAQRATVEAVSSGV